MPQRAPREPPELQHSAGLRNNQPHSNPTGKLDALVGQHFSSMTAPVKREAEDVFAPAELGLRAPWPQGWSASGVIEALDPWVGENRKQRIAEVLGSRLSSVTVVMDAPHDPHNGAAVLRSCEAFGIHQVHVVPRQEPFLASNQVAKGTQQWVGVVEHSSPEAAIVALKRQDYTLVASHPDGELLPDDLAHIPRVALLMGNEHDGLCTALARSAGRSVRIPMVGFVESLNVSVSAALLLYAATRGRSGDLDPSDQQQWWARALYHSVRRAPDILRALPAR